MNINLFNFVKWISSPFILMFIAVVTGLLFGKIKFGRFNFGVSGALFTGIVIGWLITEYANRFPEGASGYESLENMLRVGVIPKELFDMFLILFIASVGLLAAKDMNIVIKKYGVKFIVLGLLITSVSAATTYGLTRLSKGMNPYTVEGVYTGALTSSPGLAAALESSREHAIATVANFEELDDEKKIEIGKIIGIDPDEITKEDFQLTEEHKDKFVNIAEASVGAGHAIGYPFGVLIVILAVNFFPNIFRIDVNKEKEIFKLKWDQLKKRQI